MRSAVSAPFAGHVNVRPHVTSWWTGLMVQGTSAGAALGIRRSFPRKLESDRSRCHRYKNHIKSSGTKFKVSKSFFLWELIGEAQQMENNRRCWASFCAKLVLRVQMIGEQLRSGVAGYDDFSPHLEIGMLVFIAALPNLPSQGGCFYFELFRT